MNNLAIEQNQQQGDAQQAEKLIGELAALEELAKDWPDRYKNAAEARTTAIDALNAEAFRRLIRAIKPLDGAGHILKELAADPLVYAVLRRHGILKPGLFEQVENALDTVRPQLASHGGGVELVSVNPPEAVVRFLDNCDGCPASSLTFYAGVKKAIEDHVPAITKVRQDKSMAGAAKNGVDFISPFAREEETLWQRIMPMDDMKDGETRQIIIAQKDIILTRIGDKVTIFANHCAHMGMALYGGKIKDQIITCPWHGFQYSLESGECLTASEVQLIPHAVKIENGDIYIELKGA